MTTTPERPTTLEGWRELEDWVAAGDAEREARWAREYADVPPPTGATRVVEWDHVFSHDVVHRFSSGTRRGDTSIVEIHGYQNHDGTVRERWIYISTRPDELDVAAARELARSLIAAADELAD